MSTARMVNDGQLSADPGWRLVVLAAMANLAFKATIAVILSRRQLLAMSALFAIPMAAGAVLLLAA